MAKNLFQQSERNAMIKRLQQLQPDARPRWGSMSPAQLLAHLIDAFQISGGEKDITPQQGLLNTSLGRWLALRLPIPRGKIKAPSVFHETDPGAFEADKEKVIAYIQGFTDEPGRTWGVSPVFGRLSPKQWARLHRTHLDHHLKQFGL